MVITVNKSQRKTQNVVTSTNLQFVEAKAFTYRNSNVLHVSVFVKFKINYLLHLQSTSSSAKLQNESVFIYKVLSILRNVHNKWHATYNRQPTTSNHSTRHHSTTSANNAVHTDLVNKFVSWQLLYINQLY